MLPCHTPRELGARLQLLLNEPELRRSLGRRGQHRMGAPGGSAAIAAFVEARLLGQEP